MKQGERVTLIHVEPVPQAISGINRIGRKYCRWNRPYRMSVKLPLAPTERERKLLRQLVEEQLADYRRRADKAEALLKVGESPREARLEPIELAAWTIFASTLLNLDEALTKG